MAIDPQGEAHELRRMMPVSGRNIFWEARPAREAPRVIHLGPPADEIDHAAERAAGIVGGLTNGVEKTLGTALDATADFIAPPPPPTEAQVEQMQKAAEQQRQFPQPRLASLWRRAWEIIARRLTPAPADPKPPRRHSGDPRAPCF
jgi:hypothetical protein